MGIDNYLPERIVWAYRKSWVYCNVLKELKHCRDALWVNTVLWLFQAEHTLKLRVEFKHGQSQEA